MFVAKELHHHHHQHQHSLQARIVGIAVEKLERELNSHMLPPPRRRRRRRRRFVVLFHKCHRHHVHALLLPFLAVAVGMQLFVILN